MSSPRVAITGVRNFLAHSPGLVRYGSRPQRDISADPSAADLIGSHLRTYEQAARYLPNRVYLGSLTPDDLRGVEPPWYSRDGEWVRRQPFGEIMPEEEFYGVMRLMDDFDLLWLEEDFSRRVRDLLSTHPSWSETELEPLEKGVAMDQVESRLAKESGNLPLFLRDGSLIGVMNRAHDLDASLSAEVLLENIACKASAVMAARILISELDVSPDSIRYILNCGEEAVGDRYQRGGGNLAKAVGESCGLVNATGSDIKAFCCGPSHATLIGAGLLASGIFNRVLVVAGCSLAKLGMKYQGHVRNDMPVLEDVLAGVAFLMETDDGVSPLVRLDSVGTHRVGAGSSQGAVLAELVSKPLKRLGLEFGDIDKYATELHNPEVTEPAGAGNVPELNYKLIAALAARSGEIAHSDMTDFANTHGMPGFSPTQGHLASAIPYLPHALGGLSNGDLKKVMFLAKGSLFLGRMTQMADGLSFIMVPND